MISDSRITIFQLPCGLKCLHVLLPDGAVEYAGVSANVGSRNDPPRLQGLAHFVEHTIFKGTSRRTSSYIINRMEQCGGELNAYTTKETTVVYSIFPAGNFRRAADLIAELVTDSQFPKVEIDREREVVADEISSYRDIPSEAVFDDFEDHIYHGTPLGHNILGSRSDLDRITSDDCRGYLRRYYRADNMVFFYAGPLSTSKVEHIAAAAFASLPAAGKEAAISGDEQERGRLDSSDNGLRGRSINGPLSGSLDDSFDGLAPVDIFAINEGLGIHQAHTVVGCRLPGMFSQLRYPLALLINILGGPGMNSLFNVELREKRGLVYSVESSLSLLSDTGLFTTYFGCDVEDSARCLQLVKRTIDRLANNQLTLRRLDSAKRQYLGQIAVAGESTENTLLSMARSLLYRGGVVSMADTRRAIEAITPEDIRSAAEMIAPGRLSRLTFA